MLLKALIFLISSIDATSNCLTPLSKLLTEQQSVVHSASLGRIRTLEWDFEVREELFDDMMFGPNARYTNPGDYLAIKLREFNPKEYFARLVQSE